MGSVSASSGGTSANVMRTCVVRPGNRSTVEDTGYDCCVAAEGCIASVDRVMVSPSWLVNSPGTVRCP